MRNRAGGDEIAQAQALDAAPAVPSDQLQAGLSQPSRRPNWSKPRLPQWPAHKHGSDAHAPLQANRILDWLAGLLEWTEDTVDYLRHNLGRMSGQADPSARAGSEEGERLRRLLDEQLAAGVAQPDLIKATIATRARLCAAIGGLFALPGTVPGIGTAAQFALGMAATWPEADLIRHQMWCLQVELLHLHRTVYTEADAEVLGKGFLNYEWLNKGGEVVAQKLLAGLHQATAVAPGVMQRFLVRRGVSKTLQESAGRILAKTLPLGIGVAIGATVNYLKLHMFARGQLRRLPVAADGLMADELTGPVRPIDPAQVA